MSVNKIGIGTRVGRLTIAEATSERRGGYIVWRCLCDCGKDTVVGQTCLAEGKTRSCGCLQVSTICGKLKLADGTSVTRLETGLTRPSINNTSGHTGVYFNRKRGK